MKCSFRWDTEFHEPALLFGVTGHFYGRFVFGVGKYCVIFHCCCYVQGEALVPPHDSSHMSELAIEYSSALEREKEMGLRYEDLLSFLQTNIKDSQASLTVILAIHAVLWQILECVVSV